jgi:lysophospholipase L1-like esterase
LTRPDVTDSRRGDACEPTDRVRRTRTRPRRADEVVTRRAANAVACVCALALLIASSLLIDAGCRLARNSLRHNGRWISSKLLMGIRPMGSGHFVLERQALYRNALNLQAWHGYNEVHLDRVFAPGLIRARFRLDDAAYLHVIFNRDETGFDGIRLSRTALFASMYFHADPSGRYLDRKGLRDLDIGDGWHTIELDFSSGTLVAHVDARRLDTPDIVPLQRQIIGFRGGFHRAVVDDVRVLAADGSPVVVESFANLEGRHAIASAAFALLSVLAGLLIVVVSSKAPAGGAGRAAAFALLTASIAVAAITAALYGFDALVWSGSYAYYPGLTPDRNHGSAILCELETLRKRMFGIPVDAKRRWELVEDIGTDPFVLAAVGSHDSEETRAGTRAREDGEEIRVAYVGTSQTFGEGVAAEEDRFVDRIGRALATASDGRRRVTSLNFAVQGSTSDRLLAQYEDSWLASAPDVVVINLGYNDADAATLAHSLERFVQIGRRESIRTLLVVEPAAVQRKADPKVLRRKREAMRRVAAEMHVELADLAAYMEGDAVYDSGPLWWDSIHMTSLGHEEAAEFLLPRIAALVDDASKAAR